MTSWTRVSTTLKEHAISRTHAESVNNTAQFQTQLSCSPLQCKSRTSFPPTLEIFAQSAEMRPLLCSPRVRTCDIGLRGHRNEEYNPERGGRPKKEPRELSFAAALSTAESGDQALREHFALTGLGGPKNVTYRYRTPRVKNELLECAGKFLQDRILLDIRRRGIFHFVRMRQLTAQTRSRWQW